MTQKERVLQNAKKYCRYEYIKLTYSMTLHEKDIKQTIFIIMN